MAEMNPMAGVMDAFNLMAMSQLFQNRQATPSLQEAELRLKQNEYDRKLAEDEVQTSLYKMQTRKAGAEALELESKREAISLFKKLETKRVHHMLDPNAPGLTPEESAEYNVTGRTMGLIDKFHEPDPLTDAKVANLHAQTERIDAYLTQTRGWAPRIEQELALTREVYGKAEEYTGMRERYGVSAIESALTAAKGKKNADPKRIKELEDALEKTTAKVHEDFGTAQVAQSAYANRFDAVRTYHQRAEDAEKRIDALVTNPKLKAEDLDRQRTTIEQERDMYRALERKATLEVDYLKAMHEPATQATIKKQLDTVTSGLQKMAGSFRESVKAGEEERSKYALEKLNVQRAAQDLREKKFEETQEYQHNLIRAQAELVDAENDGTAKARLSTIATKYGVRVDQLLPALKDPKQAGVQVILPSPGEREKLAEGQANVATLDNIQTLYSKDYVGFLDKPIGGLKSLTGKIGKDEADFRAAVNMYEQEQRHRIYGASLTPGEKKAAMQAIPNLGMNDSEFEAAIRQSKEWETRMLGQRREVIGEASAAKQSAKEKSKAKPVNRGAAFNELRSNAAFKNDTDEQILQFLMSLENK